MFANGFKGRIVKEEFWDSNMFQTTYNIKIF